MNQNKQTPEAEIKKNNDKHSLEREKLKQIVLDHYHCTFFLPIVQDDENPFPATPLENEGRRCTYQVDKSSELSKSEQSKNTQAYHFFTPHLRTILFDTDNPVDKSKANWQLEPMREWQLPESLIRRWELSLHNPQTDEEGNDIESELNYQHTVFESVKLYRYFNGNYLLAFRVIPRALNEMRDLRDNKIVSLRAKDGESKTTEFKLKEQANSSFTLFDKKCDHQFLDDFKDDPFFDKYQALQLEAWLRFSRLARQLFPSFIEQEEEGKIAKMSLSKGEGKKLIESFESEITPSFPKSSGEQLSPIVREVLLEFFPKKDQSLVKKWLNTSFRLYDDRMFVSVAYSLSGAQHSQRTLKLINTLAAVTDRVADVWTAFDNHPYSPDALKRYLEGSQFDFWKDQAATYVYTDVANAYVSRGGFYRDIIADTHIPYIYDRMLVQALFYQTSLRYYDHAITNKTQQLLSDKTGKPAASMTALLGEFIKFTNQYWFKEVTNQMQGKEIFKLQLNRLGLDAQFEQLQDEINRTNDYLRADYEQQQTEKSNGLAAWALLIAIIALLPVINDIFKPEASLWTSLSCWLGEFFMGQTANVAAADSLWRVLIAAGVLALPLGFLGWKAFKTLRKSG